MAIGISMPESDEDRHFLTTSEAKKLLKVNDGLVHNFIPQGNFLIGADIEYEHIDDIFNDAKSIEVAGENAMRAGHGIAVIDGDGVVSFWEHNPEVMDKLEDNL